MLPLEIIAISGRIPSWILVLLISNVLLLALAYSSNRKAILSLSDSLAPFGSFQTFLKEEKLLTGFTGLLLLFASLLGQGMAIWSSRFSEGGAGVAEFIIYFIVLGLLYLMKSGLAIFLGYVFDAEVLAKEYLYALFSLFVLMGVVLIPLNLMSLFSGVMSIQTAWQWTQMGSLLVMSYFVFKVVQIAFREHIKSYYIFIYLCTLEILPLIVLIHWMQQLRLIS